MKNTIQPRISLNTELSQIKQYETKTTIGSLKIIIQLKSFIEVLNYFHVLRTILKFTFKISDIL